MFGMLCRNCGGQLEWEDEVTLYCSNCCEYEYLNPEDEGPTFNVDDEFREDKDDYQDDTDGESGSLSSRSTSRLPSKRAPVLEVSAYQSLTHLQPSGEYTVILGAAQDQHLIPSTGGSRHIVYDVHAKPHEDHVNSDCPLYTCTVVLDTSKSMHGRKLETAKHLAMTIIGCLNSRDRVALIRMSGQDDFELQSAATSDRKPFLYSLIGDASARGNTNLQSALVAAYQTYARCGTPCNDELRLCFLITDARPNMGERNIGALASCAHEALRRYGVKTIVLGVGSQGYEPLLEAFASIGGGISYQMEQLHHMDRRWLSNIIYRAAILPSSTRLEITGAPLAMVRIVQSEQIRVEPTRESMLSVALGELRLDDVIRVVTCVEFPSAPRGTRALLRARLLFDATGVPHATDWTETIFTYSTEEYSTYEHQNQAVTACVSHAYQAITPTKQHRDKSIASTANEYPL